MRTEQTGGISKWEASRLIHAPNLKSNRLPKFVTRMSIHATQGMYNSMHVGVLPSKHPIANALWADDQQDTIHCILLPHCLIVLQWRQQDVALGLFVLVDPVSRGLATLVVSSAA